MDDRYYASATEIAARVWRGDLSPVEVVDAFLERIDRRNDDLTAYVTVAEDAAREAAREVERAVEQGKEVGPLAGVPVALKDLHGLKEGVRQTYGSVLFADNVAERDATFVERLEDAGAIVLGITNTPEFGHKATTDNPLFGPTSNPFDPDRNAGGSSGGSAAALADGLATLAHGGDAGGSLRIPAAWSGVYTLKPTYRRIASADRPNAFGASHGHYIHHGPMGRSVEDVALMLDVMAGPHPRDPTSLPDDGTDYRGAVERASADSTVADSTVEDLTPRRCVADLDVAYTPDFGTFPVEERILEVVEDALGAFEQADAGPTIAEADVGLGHSHDELTAVWRKSVAASFAAMDESFERDRGDHDDSTGLLDAHRDDLTDEVVELIEEGRDLSAAEYLNLQSVQTEVFDAIEDTFEEYDLLVSPTLACLPVENADASEGSTLGPAEIDGEPVDPLIGWCLTHPFNFTGHPAASIPAGFADGLPVGMQIVGPRFAEEEILAASAVFERVRPWDHAYPPR
jgi:amidase/aspartyl-tRNA(Asn)/glutamyl-tRNA(Gln) amidotransferase subunit A